VVIEVMYEVIRCGTSTRHPAGFEPVSGRFSVRRRGGSFACCACWTDLGPRRIRRRAGPPRHGAARGGVAGPAEDDACGWGGGLWHGCGDRTRGVTGDEDEQGCRRTDNRRGPADAGRHVCSFAGILAQGSARCAGGAARSRAPRCRLNERGWSTRTQCPLRGRATASEGGRPRSQSNASPVPQEVLEHVQSVLVLDRNPAPLAQDHTDHIGV